MNAQRLRALEKRRRKAGPVVIGIHWVDDDDKDSDMVQVGKEQMTQAEFKQRYPNAVVFKVVYEDAAAGA